MAHQSLADVHSSVATAHPSLWKRMFAFAGPAYLVSVGYMDPGNWASDIEGGARFGYQLLWVLAVSNGLAILLQTLSARLGIASGRDLAQACREAYPRPVVWALWLLCEIAIAACDLAEVLGAAIGIRLLTGWPLLLGVAITAFDSLAMLWLTRYGIRVLETVVLGFISVIAGCFFFQVFLARPDPAAIAAGLIPRLNDQSLYVAIAILGATVMPHNLYLHSSLVQTRIIGVTLAARRTACKFNLIDSAVALNGAFLVNAAILVLSGAVFFTKGIAVTEIAQAHQLLAPLLGTALASAAFAVALLFSGLSSTITGTMAGQIVMEGFLELRMQPWLRRFVTRSVAIIPAAAVIWIQGEAGTYRLLILSQVILSLQLPFAVIPLVHFTSDRVRMGQLANARWVRWLAWAAAGLILALNLRLAKLAIGDWLAGAGSWLWWLVGPLLAGLSALLAYVAAEPWLWRRARAAEGLPGTIRLLPAAPYRRILVPLDHSRLDQHALAHAAALARPSGARLFLLHVEEGVPSQLFGDLASTAEIEAGERYFQGILNALAADGIEADLHIVHSGRPKAEIVRYAREIKPDLVVMGAHGHAGWRDLLFGATINDVRHGIPVPILAVRVPELP